MSVIKVSELNKYIKKYIAMDYLLSDISVEGEVSNYKEHSNGNIYLSLKDKSARINGIIYSNDAANMKISPKNGDNVEVRGSISLYERDGILNIYIREIKILGVGNLYEKYLALKEVLYKEGLFNENNKKKIPFFPKEIGIITSPTGAAIRDILNIIKRRNDAIDISIFPTNVQGSQAVSGVIDGIKYFSENPVDVIIVTRGGGSIEELFSFNDESLAREIYKSKIPIISAIGHEIDYVISDFVSDLRAPTPSAAAELVSMSKEDLNNSLYLLKNKMDRIIENNIEKEKIKLNKNFDSVSRRIFNEISDSKNKMMSVLLSLKNDSYKLNTLKFDLNTLYVNLNRNFKENLKTKEYFLEDKLQDLKYSLKSSEIRVDELNNLRDKLEDSLLKIFREKKYNLQYLYLDLKKSTTFPKVYIKDEFDKLIINASSLKERDKISINFEDGQVISDVRSVKIRGDKSE